MKPSVRFEVFKRDNFTCRYCGRKTPEAILQVDHVIPKAEGGPDSVDNLVTSCVTCNLGKGARLLTSIPDDLDLQDRAAAIAEQERQIQEYRHWRGLQRQREDQDVAELYDRFCGEFLYRERRKAFMFWVDATVREFVRKIGFNEVEDVLEYVAASVDKGRDDMDAANHRWRVFCKLCWNRIRKSGQPREQG